MLIGEIAHNGEQRRIGMVGSCRLHDPLKAAMRDAGGRFIWSAHNAFSHSPEEALQHLRVCLGKIEVPDPFAPYMMRQDHAPLLPETLAPLVESCDTLVIEVSSFDLLRCGAYLFNQDYFAQTFVRGKGLALLEWHRRIGAEPVPDDIVVAAEEALVAANIPASPARREILRTLRKIPSPDHGLAAMRTIAGMAPTIVFVPIFNIADAPQSLRDDRARVAEYLRESARAVGAGFVDPTPVVARLARAEVLDGGGADVFHLAPSFLLTMGRALLPAILEGGHEPVEIPEEIVSMPAQGGVS